MISALIGLIVFLLLCIGGKHSHKESHECRTAGEYKPWDGTEPDPLALEYVMTKTPVWHPHRQGKSWPMKVMGDTWLPGTKLSPEKRKELSEALYRAIERRLDDDITSIMEDTRRGIESSMGVPRHMRGIEDELDGTLDYSWLAPTHLRGTGAGSGQKS